MATYTELFEQRQNSALRNKIAVAVTVYAHSLIIAATPTTAELEWAKSAIENPVAKADSILPFILAANKAATIANIEAATDVEIQTQTELAASKLIGVA